MGNVRIFSTSLLELTVQYLAYREAARARKLPPLPPLSDTSKVALEVDEKYEEAALELWLILRRLGCEDAKDKANLAAAAASKVMRFVERNDLSLSVTRYEEQRNRVLKELNLVSQRGVQLWPPTSQTVIMQMGGRWNSALKRCGLVGVERGNFGRSNTRFSVDDHRRAIRAFIEDCEDEDIRPTYARYGQWVQDQKPMPRPSGPLIRQTYGTWREALLRLIGYEID